MMNNQDQLPVNKYFQEDYLQVWIEVFLFDRKTQNMSKGTLEFYQCKLQNFINFCESKAVKNIMQITPNLLREYLLEHEMMGHNPKGCHAAYRTVKTFLRWWENEVEPQDWTNPIKKVKAPKIVCLQNIMRICFIFDHRRISLLYYSA